MTDTAAIARLEKAIDKLADATEKQTETLHAMQLEQRSMAGSISAIELLAKQTSSTVAAMEKELDGTKDKVAQLDGEVYGEGGLKEQVKELKAVMIIRDGPKRMEKVEKDLEGLVNKDNSRAAVWAFFDDTKGKIILFSFFVGIIFTIVTWVNRTHPTPLAQNTNQVVNQMKEKIEAIEGGQ